MAVEEKCSKLFQTGRSQAVRLPKEFRFAETEVRIRRAGQTVVLEFISDDWKWLDELQAQVGGGLDADFIAATEEEVPQQLRPELGKLFQ